MAAQVHAEAWEIRRRLSELSLALEPLQKAAEVAIRERRLCTPNDPPFIPGTQAWRFVVRTLREDLPLIGAWKGLNLGNYSLIVNDEAKLNIVVASGDASTGRPGSPRTKSIKGLFTQAAVERNNVVGELFPETIPQEVIDKAKLLGYPTWIYLIYTSDSEVRAELSFPEYFDSGDITSWKERIFIPDIKIDPTDAPDGGDKDSGPDFDIDVRLR